MEIFQTMRMIKRATHWEKFRVFIFKIVKYHYIKKYVNLCYCVPYFFFFHHHVLPSIIRVDACNFTGLLHLSQNSSTFSISIHLMHFSPYLLLILPPYYLSGTPSTLRIVFSKICFGPYFKISC